MAEARLDRARRGLVHTWRALDFEQRVAGVGALLLIVSTFGSFSFVEAAVVLVAGGVLALLRARGEGATFRLPFGDGVVIAAAGAWAGLLIAVRVFERPLGQNLLALGCAAILVIAGLAMRAKHREPPTEPLRPSPPTPPDRAETQALPPSD